MFFGCTVVSIMTRARSAGFMAPVRVARKALLQQRLQPFRAHAIAPVGHRGAIERQAVLEKLLATEILVIRILDPQLARDLVAEVVGVLENGKPGHQPGRQGRLSTYLRGRPLSRSGGFRDSPSALTAAADAGLVSLVGDVVIVILRRNVMLKWKVAAVMGLAFGVAGIGWGYAQQRQAPGFYELRVYSALSGKRDALAQRFADHTAAIFARHGITNVGYSIPQQSDPELGINAENTFIYIRGYPSKEERDKRLKAMTDDPECTEVMIKAEANPETKLVAKVHNIVMTPHGPYTAITLAK
jgi:hypothetical protein